MDLTKMMEVALAAMLAEGKMQEIIEKQVSACVLKALSDATGYGSAFQKALNAAVATALPMDLSSMNLPRYNDAVIKVIREKMDGCLFEWVNKSFAESMGELLEPAPESIRLNEFVRALRKNHREHAGEGAEGQLSAHTEESSHGYWSVKIEAGKYDAYDIGVTKEGAIYSIRTPLNGEVTKKLFAGRSYGVERMLWWFYLGKTKLIMEPVDAVAAPATHKIMKTTRRTQPGWG